MKIQHGKKYAVLTGDVVGSTRLKGDDRLKLLEVMREVSRDIQKEYHKDVPLAVDIFRGDSWQVLVRNPQHALRIGLYFRARIRSGVKSHRVDTRFSIGLGGVDFIPEDHVSSGDGEAFWLSGHGLERMPRNRRMVVLLPASFADCLSDASDSLLFLIDTLATRWTRKQAEAISGAIAGLTQERIAQNWMDHPITQQAVAQHLERAGWNAIEHGLHFFERWLSLPKQLSLE